MRTEGSSPKLDSRPVAEPGLEPESPVFIRVIQKVTQDTERPCLG